MEYLHGCLLGGSFRCQGLDPMLPASAPTMGDPWGTDMKIVKAALGLLVALVVVAVAGWFSLDKETRALLATLPTNADLLFWNQEQRDAAFRALDRLPVLAKSRVIPAGNSPRPLPPGPPLELPID